MKRNKLLCVLLAATVLLCAAPMVAIADATALTVDTPTTLIPGDATAEATFTPAQTGLYGGA